MAGTKKAITAIQMDIKIDGLTREVIEEALEQARQGRLAIMDHMLQTIDHPQNKVQNIHQSCNYACNPDKIRDVIGPGGKKNQQELY